MVLREKSKNECDRYKEEVVLGDVIPDTNIADVNRLFDL